MQSHNTIFTSNRDANSRPFIVVLQPAVANLSGGFSIPNLGKVFILLKFAKRWQVVESSCMNQEKTTVKLAIGTVSSFARLCGYSDVSVHFALCPRDILWLLS